MISTAIAVPIVRVSRHHLPGPQRQQGQQGPLTGATDAADLPVQHHVDRAKDPHLDQLPRLSRLAATGRTLNATTSDQP
jgi:hypothetical protein